MNGVTIMLVNWNAKECMELALKTFWIHHKHQPVHLMLWDNASNDGSKEWLYEQGIPFYDSQVNIGHEQAINVMYPAISTKWVLLIDSDVIFNRECLDNYGQFLSSQVLAAGDLIRGDQLNAPVKPRLGAWFVYFDIEECRKIGILKFRDTTDWSMDVGSHFYDRLWRANKDVHIIQRLPGHIDYDVLGMRYGTHDHLGKVSWNIENHGDRRDEVAMRRAYVHEELKKYQDIELKGKFI